MLQQTDSEEAQRPTPAPNRGDAAGGEDARAAQGAARAGDSGEQRAWHAMSTDEVQRALDVDVSRGLGSGEVRRRRERHGENRLHQAARPSVWALALDQFRSVVVYILAIAAVVALIFGEWLEAAAVTAVLLINAGIGLFTELRAIKSMEALRDLGEHRCAVVREGTRRAVPASELVPGDVVRVEGADVVPADLRLIEAARLRVDEAALTGESVPADKTSDAVAADASLGERGSMLFKGTTVAEGEATALVVATGKATELGRISQLAEEAESNETPLQQRLDALGARLGIIAVSMGVVIGVLGVLVGGAELREMVTVAIALGVAAVPEGLPIVATIALARGMHRMAKRNALINRLTAVETLGATRIICTDKTGTLTENRMTLRRVVAPGGDWIIPESGGPPRPHRAGERAIDDAPGEGAPGEGAAADGDAAADGGAAGEAEGALRRVIELGVLCNGAELGVEASEQNPKGDPTEIALLKGARSLDLTRERLLAARPELRVESFDPRIKMMATLHRDDGAVLVAVKGAPDAVLERCTQLVDGRGGVVALDEATRRAWEERAHALAAEGLRVLAVASKAAADARAEPYEGLTFAGLTGLLDPPREEVEGAIRACRAAGVRVVMVTGDQPATGQAIARAVGIVDDDDDTAPVHGRELQDPAALDADTKQRILNARVFARVSPEQKLNLVSIFQGDQDEGRQETIAMTGDGVNDAPALKKADIGIAMGARGTEAAKQVADMVLTDDRFSSIVAAIEQGRVIFANIRKSVLFMLCTNVAEVLAVGFASLTAPWLGWPLPLTALQILYLNVLTDVFPAMALAVGEGTGHEMKQPPRARREDVLTRSHWLQIGGWATLVAAVVLGALGIAQALPGVSKPVAVTVSFLTLGFGKLWFVFNLRDPQAPALRNSITLNPWIWASFGMCALLLCGAVYIPGLNAILGTTHPGLDGWLLIAGASLAPLLVGQLVLLLIGRRGGAGAATRAASPGPALAARRREDEAS